MPSSRPSSRPRRASAEQPVDWEPTPWHAPNSSAADFTAIALPRSGNRDDDNRQVVTLRVSEVRGLHAIITHASDELAEEREKLREAKSALAEAVPSSGPTRWNATGSS